MAARRFGKMAMLGSALVLTATLGSNAVQARTRSSAQWGHVSYYRAYNPTSYHSASYHPSYGMHPYARHAHWGRPLVRYTWSGGRLQCVPFARENTGIELSGNAATWWAAAAGVYERGVRPEVGSILNFRATGRMRMGHVAVVSNVVNSRSIEIDQANWRGPDVERGGISHDITVIDVSPSNDWSQVRVALGHTGELGSVYPTYGFIYDRPDSGTMVANAGVQDGPASQIANAAPSDPEEVAEAEDDTMPRATRHRGGWHHSRFSNYARVYRIHTRADFSPHHLHSRHRRT